MRDTGNLNDPYREVYRAHPTPDDTALPEYRPTPGQRENMLALVALLAPVRYTMR